MFPLKSAISVQDLKPMPYSCTYDLLRKVLYCCAKLILSRQRLFFLNLEQELQEKLNLVDIRRLLSILLTKFRDSVDYESGVKYTRYNCQICREDSMFYVFSIWGQTEFTEALTCH
jgi:hypothetical protein